MFSFIPGEFGVAIPTRARRWRPRSIASAGRSRMSPSCSCGFPAGIRAKILAGQYLRIKMPDGDTRNFSMANPPHESDGVQLHIRHVPGDVSRRGCLPSSAPATRSTSNCRTEISILRSDSDKPVVCLATGTGFAPLKSIVEDLIKRGNKRPVHLYWGGRRQRDLYLADLPQKWASARRLVQVYPRLVGARPGLERSRGPGSSRRAEGFDRFVGVGGLCLRQPPMIRQARRDFRTTAGLSDGDFFADPFVPSGNDPAAPG